MAKNLVTECLLQGICLCASYYYPDAKLDAGDSCLGSVPSYQHFATGTDYNLALEPYLNETTEPVTVPDGCRPSLFYLFQRHTIRYPNADEINKSHVLLPEIQSNLRDNRRKSNMCDKDIDAILNWESRFQVEDGNEVTETGKSVVRQQVRRLRTRFPSVFGQRDGLNNVVVDFSPKGNRTKDTGSEFLEEWFGEETFRSKVADQMIDINPLNTFHDTCKAITKNHSLDVTSPNKEILWKSHVFKQFKRTLEKRLGFDIKKRDVKAILRQCRFEMTAYGASPWCALLGDEELRLAELLDDVEIFDEESYGQRRNEMAACPVAVDLLLHIRNLTKEDVELPKVVLHFSHSGAFKRILTLFELGRSTVPPEDCGQRLWLTSRLCPFNANLNFVYFSCPKHDEDRVAFLLNEKLEHLPGCKDELCTVKEMEELLQPKADSCDLETICAQ